MSKKYVMINFLVHESDALKNYLEDMALQGWKLEKIGNVFLHFTSCPLLRGNHGTPQRLRV